MARNKTLAAVEAAVEGFWIKTLQPIEHDGEKIAQGAIAWIEKEAGELLVDLGFAEKSAPPADAPEVPPTGDAETKPPAT